MNRNDISKRCGLFGVLLLGSCLAAQAQEENITAAGIPQGYSTIHCIGIEWRIKGDADHDATCRVEYRKIRDAEWKEA